MSESAPKKSLGQHWLHDAETLDAIVKSAEVTKADTVLEIGPGLGTLTAVLAKQAGSVLAVEFDEVLALELPYRVADENVEVVQADILDFDLSRMPEGFKVVANIPYYLTSHLIRKLCESKPAFSVAAILIQKEVAERVAAKPGDTSMLSITAQYYCEVSLGREVPAKLFTPPPKVDSQVLVLKRRKQPLSQDVDEVKFFSLIKAGFSERRKKLRSSLSGGLHISKTQADELLSSAGISPDLRAQALDMGQWLDLYMQWQKISPLPSLL